MPSTLSVTRVSELTAIETFTGDFISPQDNTVTDNQLNERGTYTAVTSVPVTKRVSFRKALVAGAGTIDLTALPGLTADETVTFLNLKVQAAMFRNPSTNANPITVTFGASNPYLLLGAGFLFILKPGQSTGPVFLDEAAPDVASGAKNIDISGTGTQALDVQMVAG